MTRFPEAEARKLHNVFVCRRCKTKIRAPNMKVLQGKVVCRNCGRNQLRAIRRK